MYHDYPEWLYNDPDMKYFPPIDDPAKESIVLEECTLLEEEIFDSGFMPIPEDWLFSSDDPNPLDNGLDYNQLAQDIYDYRLGEKS